MNLASKAIYIDFLFENFMDELNEIHIEKDSLSSLSAQISDRLHDYLVTTLNELRDKISNMRNSGYFDSLPNNSYVIMIWDCYLDLIIHLATTISDDPSIMSKSENTFSTLIEAIISVPSQIATAHEGVGLMIGENMNGINNEKLKDRYYQLFESIKSMNSTLQVLKSKQDQETQERMLDVLSGKRFSKFSELIDSRIKDIDEKSNYLHEMLLSEKKSLHESLSDFSHKAEQKIEYFSNKETNVNDVADKVVALYDMCDEKVRAIDGILIGVNQEGMASAFQKRHEDLKWPEYRWMALFTIALLLLTCSGWLVLETALSSDENKLTEVISRIAISLPLVWLAWFSAKQYNHVSRLREDYAYKVAVAMAYNGYKDKANEESSEMSKKLLDNIIVHFAENPVRLYEKNNSASIIESLIKNNKVSEVVTAIRGEK